MSQQPSTKLEKAQNNLRNIASLNLTHLIERAELGPFNFKNEKSLFEQTIQLANDLQSLPIDILPAGIIEMLEDESRKVLEVLVKLYNFNLEDTDNPKSWRESTMINARNVLDQFRQIVLPFVGYLYMKKGDADLSRSTDLIQKIDGAFSAEMLKAKKTNAELSSIVNAARTAIGKVGVDKHSSDFQNIAGKHEKSSRIWLGITAFLVVVIASFSWYFISHNLPKGELSQAATIQRIVSKLIFLSTLYFAIILSAKNYRANKHLAVTNEHRQTALQTFQTFVKSAGDDLQTKNAILLEATRTIFSPTATGYLTNEDENQSNRVIEILKTVGGSSGK